MNIHTVGETLSRMMLDKGGQSFEVHSKILYWSAIIDHILESVRIDVRLPLDLQGGAIRRQPALLIAQP